MSKNEKTNVGRVLDSKKIQYKTYTYENTGAVSGVEVAKILGQNPAQVFKTLVTIGKSKQHYVFVIPVERELDLKKAAASVGEKNIEMIPQKELLPLTGYIHGGCSPIGMKKKYPTWFDETAMLYDEIAVSAGVRGMQIIIHPDHLKEFVEAEYEDVTQ